MPANVNSITFCLGRAITEISRVSFSEVEKTVSKEEKHSSYVTSQYRNVA